MEDSSDDNETRLQVGGFCLYGILYGHFQTFNGLFCVSTFGAVLDSFYFYGVRKGRILATRQCKVI